MDHKDQLGLLEEDLVEIESMFSKKDSSDQQRDEDKLSVRSYQLVPQLRRSTLAVVQRDVPMELSLSQSRFKETRK